MTNYTVYEGSRDTVYTVAIKCIIGDTIEYISNNQQGYMKYRVIKDNQLKVIDSYEHQIGEIEYDDDTSY